MARRSIVRRGFPLGYATLVGGCALLTASLFIPWLYLTTSFFPGEDGIEWFSPGNEAFYALTGRRTALIPFSLAFLFVAVVIVARTAIQAWRPERVSRRGTIALVATLALVGLGMVGIALFVLPFGLEFGYPYYDVTPEIGGFIAAAGLICALSGALLLEPAPFHQLNSAAPTTRRRDGE